MNFKFALFLLILISFLPEGKTQKVSISTQTPALNFSYGTHFFNGPIFGPGTPFGHLVGDPIFYQDLCRIERIPSSGTEFGQAVYVDLILKIKLERDGFTIPHGPDCNNPQLDYTQGGSAMVFTVDVSIRRLSNNQLVTRYVRYSITNVSQFLDIYGMRSYNIGDENNPPQWSDYIEQHVRLLPTNLDPGCCGDAVILDQKSQTYLFGSQVATLDNIQIRGDSGGTDLSPDSNCSGDHRIDYIKINDYLEIWVSDDIDGDGVPDQGTPPNGVVFDNCVGVTNPSQSNSDNDNFGNVCDNCPFTTNVTQADFDGDFRGDVCDNCPVDSNIAQTNSDFDTFGDACDNCPLKTNQDQSDIDNDGIGDACDFEDCPIEAIYQIESYSYPIFESIYTKQSTYLIYYDQNEVSFGDQLTYSNFFINGTVTIDSYPIVLTVNNDFGGGSPFNLDLQFSSVPQCTFPLVGEDVIDSRLDANCLFSEEVYCDDSDNYVFDINLGILSDLCIGVPNIIEIIDKATGISIPFTFDNPQLFMNVNFDAGIQTVTVVFGNSCGARTFCDIIIDVQDCGLCPLSYEITDPISQNLSLQASDYISISNSIDATLDVAFKAGNYMLLNPGFSINTNTEFLGEIATCNEVEVCNVECDCDDGLDDDGDGMIDCNDADCFYNYNCICTPGISVISCLYNQSYSIRDNFGLSYVSVNVYDLILLPCNQNYTASFSSDGLDNSKLFDCNDIGDVQVTVFIFQSGEWVDTCYPIVEINDNNNNCFF